MRQEGCDKDLGAQAQSKAVKGICMSEAPLKVSRLPGWPQLASEDFGSIQVEQVARGPMRILRLGASDGRGLPRQSIIEGVEGSWALGCEDGSEGLAQPYLGRRGQPAGNDRWVEARDLSVEVVWYGQAEAPGQHLVIATCPDVAGLGAQAGSVKATQGDGNMHMVAVGIRMTGRDPRSAPGGQAHKVELRHDNRMPRFATGPQSYGQRQCHVHHSRTIREVVQAVAHENGICAGDCATDEFRTVAQVIVGQDAGRFVEGVMRAHRSAFLNPAELLREPVEEKRQVVELFGSDIFGVQRHTDLTDKIRDRPCADFGFQSPSADEYRAALRSRGPAQRFQQRKLLL